METKKENDMNQSIRKLHSHQEKEQNLLQQEAAFSEPAESHPNPLKSSLALPVWRSLVHHCFMLIIVLCPLAKLCPPFTVIWHLPNVSHTLENNAVGTGL